VLRDSEGGSVDLAKVDPIPRLDQGLEEIEQELATAPGQKALDILEEEGRRFVFSDKRAEHADESVPVVVCSPKPRRGKALAWRSSGNE